MAATEVIECVKFGTNQAQHQAFKSYNSNYNRVNTRDVASNFAEGTPFIIDATDGVMNCKIYDKYTSLFYESKKYLFLAKGPAKMNGDIEKHDVVHISDKKIQFTDIATPYKFDGSQQTVATKATTKATGTTKATNKATVTDATKLTKPGMTTVTQTPKTGGVVNTDAPDVGKLIKNDECNKKLGCFDDCMDGKCTMLSSWIHKGNNSAEITLKSVAGSDDAWMAFGFSKNKVMDKTTVVECVKYGSSVGAFMSYNDRYNNKRAVPQNGGVNLEALSDTSGIFTCTILIFPDIISKFQPVNLTEKYHVILSHGKAKPDGIKLKHNAAPIVSKQKFSLKSMDVVSFEKKDNFMVKVHGSLMLTAWILVSSIGIYIARYYKTVWSQSTICQTAVWFALHRNCMLVTFMLTVAGFCVIFIEVGGYSSIGKQSPLVAAHPLLGIIATFFVVINPIMGVFRCHPGQKNRWLFDWTHWFVGVSAWVLANVAIFTAFHIDRAQTGDIAKYIWYAYMAYQGVAVLTQEIIKCFAKRNTKRSNTYTFENNKNEGDSWYSNTRKNKDVEYVMCPTFRTILLGGHILMNSAFLAALVILLVIGEAKFIAITTAAV